MLTTDSTVHPKVSKSVNKNEEWWEWSVYWTKCWICMLKTYLNFDQLNSTWWASLFLWKWRKKNGIAFKYSTQWQQFYLGHWRLDETGTQISWYELMQWYLFGDINLGSTDCVVLACPYYTSKTLLEVAEIVFCPYNYLIEPCKYEDRCHLIQNLFSLRQILPVIREAYDINLKDCVVIIDEGKSLKPKINCPIMI
jgi:hypothetical protein